MSIRGALVRLGYFATSRGWTEPAMGSFQHLTDYIYLRKFFRQFEINCVLDVGANTGGYARLLRRLGYRGKIVSFEPNPDAFAVLRGEFRDDPAWQGQCVALGSSRGRVAFHVATSNNESSFLDRPEGDWVARVDEVELIPLDALFADLVKPLDRPRVFLKMDTQGYDLEVIRGATACLDGIVAIQSEVSVQPLYEGMTHYTDALAHYESLGYTLMHLALVLRGKKHENVVEYDALMARLDDGGRRD